MKVHGGWRMADGDGRTSPFLRHLILVSLLAIHYPLFTIHRLCAQTDLYPFPEVDGGLPKKEEPKPVEPFLQALAKKMEVPENVLAEASQKGFGRLELIRLILISKKSGNPLPDLILEREKGVRFSKIAESSKADNRAIKKESQVLLKQLEKEAEKIKPEVSRSSMTAGTEDQDKNKK